MKKLTHTKFELHKVNLNKVKYRSTATATAAAATVLMQTISQETKRERLSVNTHKNPSESGRDRRTPRCYGEYVCILWQIQVANI